MHRQTEFAFSTLRDKLTYRLWSAKQIQNKPTFRLWYLKQVLRGERELRLVHSLSDPRRLTLDVGSNRGLYAIAAIRFSKQVIAFEPQPYYASFLRRYLPPSIDVRECAISDTRGTARLLVPSDPRFHAEARLTSEGNEPLGTSPNFVPIVVPTMRLDDVVQDLVGLIKIDVEGHEIEVLNGASKLIERSRPNVIIEIENRHRPGAVGRAFEWFEQKGYIGYHLTNTALSATTEIGRDSGKYPYNFIFLPAERQPTMRASIFAALSGVLAL